MIRSIQKRCVFTTSQWEEFKHQSLIYRYMVLGVPVPTDLLFALKRSLESSSILFPQKQAKWGWYPMGFNRKEDPEPERCKRTDGKKWRCSREAHRESKFCERHMLMHRGRNKSRKHVEHTITTSTTSPVMKIHSNFVHDQPFIQTRALLHPTSPYSQSSPVLTIHSNSVHDKPSIRTSALLHPASLSSQSCSRRHSSSTEQLCLESGSSYKTNINYGGRILQGMRDGGGNCFPKISKTERNQQESYLTSEMAFSDYFQTLNDRGKFEDQRRQEDRNLKHHCFTIDSDLKPAKSIKLDRGEESLKPFHHFSSEWPLISKAHWLDNGDAHPNHASLLNTQLPTSTPLSTLELFQPKPSIYQY